MTKFFLEALKEAKKAAEKNEVPIGAVLVKDGKIIARACNQTERRGQFFAHAELLCLERASKKLRSKYLVNCELYVTLEPCRMCRYAAALSRIASIHYLLSSKKFGARGPGYSKSSIRRHRHALSNETLSLLQSFFRTRRSK